MAQNSGEEAAVCFVDEVAASQYDCGICFNKMQDPVSIGCGSHLFCSGCIQTLSSHHPSGAFPCPMCRKPCNRSKVERITFIDRLMGQLQVRCPNRHDAASP